MRRSYYSSDCVVPTVPTTTCSVLLLLSIFLCGDIMSISCSHEALSTRVRVLGSGVAGSGADFMSQSFHSQKYRLIIRPEALNLEGIDSNSKSFFLDDHSQFIRQCGAWELQTTINQPTGDSQNATNQQQCSYQQTKCFNSGTNSDSRISDPVAIDVHQQLLQIDDVILVEKGQKFPVDGIVLEKAVRLYLRGCLVGGR